MFINDLKIILNLHVLPLLLWIEKLLGLLLCMNSSSKLRELKPRFCLLHLTLVDKRDLKTLHARVNTVQLLFDIVIYHYFFL